MSDEAPDRLSALLSIIEDPKAAKKLADQMAALDKAKTEFKTVKAELDAREKSLDERQGMLNRVEAEQGRERDRQAAAEASLADRADKIKAAEDKLQADIVAHGQQNLKTSAELNNREQKVTKREAELDRLEAKAKADRGALDKKLQKAQEFLNA